MATMPKAGVRLIGGVEFLKISAAAEMLGVSTGTIRKWCEEGQLSYIQRDSGHRLITLESARKMRRRTLARLYQEGEVAGDETPTTRVESRPICGIAIKPLKIAYALMRGEDKPEIVVAGEIRIPPDMEFAKRLQKSPRQLTLLLKEAQPACVALITPLVVKGRRTKDRLPTSNSHDAVVLAARDADVPLREYTYDDIDQVLGAPVVGEVDHEQVVMFRIKWPGRNRPDRTLGGMYAMVPTRELKSDLIGEAARAALYYRLVFGYGERKDVDDNASVAG